MSFIKIQIMYIELPM